MSNISLPDYYTEIEPFSEAKSELPMPLTNTTSHVPATDAIDNSREWVENVNKILNDDYQVESLEKSKSASWSAFYS